MPREMVEIQLTRNSSGQAWGFRIVGGRDEGLVCKVEKVKVKIKFVFLLSSILCFHEQIF